MRRRIIILANLIELIENGTISIISVESKLKACVDIEVTDRVTPEKFTESIQYLDKAELFSDGIDFYYEFIGSKVLLIDCAMQDPWLDAYYCVKCAIKDGVSPDDVDKKLRETFFKKMFKELAL